MGQPKNDLCKGLVDIAIRQQLPLWIADEIIPYITTEQAQIIDSCATRSGEIKYLSGLFPELKHKIKYRYETPRKRTDRTMFRDRLRTLLRCNLEYNNISVRSLTESMMEFLLGYSINDLMPHLENQFTAKMTWENQGEVWHLDHIYPCARLRFASVHDINFKRLWSMKNLRPLCKRENIKKGSSLPRCGENG